MGEFTPLTAADIAAIAAAFDLGPVARWATIAAGTINTNVSVETARGRFFVRVNEGKAEADVAWEARLVAALAAAGVATPPPVAAVAGPPYAPLPGAPGKFVSAFPWRAGHHLAPTEVTPATAAALGAALARLHVVGLALPAAWRRPSIYDHAHLVARHAGFAGSVDPVLAPAIAVLGEELAAAAAATDVRRAATHGLIHGDLFRDNVLWEGATVAALLDFEQASGGSLVYDLAVCVHDWCWTGGIAWPLVGALVAGYQAVRPLTGADRAALPVELRAAAARFTITRITDVYLASVPNPDKDFRAFLARCDAWRGGALGQLPSVL